VKRPGYVVLAAAVEAADLHRVLAEGNPRKYRYDLANSLGTQAELLAGAGRPSQALVATSEAAPSLAQAWHPGARPAGQEPDFDPAVLRTAYRADPATFLATWHAVTGTGTGPAALAHYSRRLSSLTARRQRQ
jgi:hypothetical protein